MSYIHRFSMPVLLVISFGCEVRSSPAERPPDTPLQDEFVDVRGDKFRLPGPNDCKAIVLIFVGYDCPISNGYAPEVVRICREYAPQKVAFCVVYADADISRDEARKHTHEYRFCCPAILDPKMTLAGWVGATVKPEVAVLSPKGELLYRGRINDLHIDFGKKRAQPTTHDLRDTLEAVLAGKPVPVARTKAIGCYIDFPKEK